ncbi:precorrin-2 dehydrogenase/sirohydrochlorin ferrochelatase family protein [Aneurinibacillus aneurinilyticus]|uniref:precorrin-2 dehydrogenase/sirohydrochlorin ferrochelatase family protein n=1 Tax=Aneurinibacillus aneurinilyticus TaxID=1391 RepID=UPI0023F1107B|nr:NAD(P)-dependent oxidoreductase [Aneurinibacillus aneurinilyticus]MCI1694551.1 siroheme synthase [Aneurinibacillus aneurinilyticus]
MAEHSYPAMLQLTGRRCFVVGGGRVAERKTAALLDTGAFITVVSPTLTERLHTFVQTGRIEWREKAFEPEDIQEALLVFAATDSSEVNTFVLEALKPGQLINIADRPDLSTFTVPAQLRRGRLLMTVATEGASPGLARKLVNELGEIYDETYEVYVDFLAEARRIVLERVESPHRRRRLFKRLLEDDFLYDARRQEPERLWGRFWDLVSRNSKDDT